MAAVIDWTASMQQTFEFYEVDPGTWKDRKRITCIKNCSLSRDDDTETLGTASFDVSEDIGECYIRTYLVANQNGVKHKIALGTYLVQAPSQSFDGKERSLSLDGYTPLIELKENRPPIGSYIAKGSNIMTSAYKLLNEHLRAPVYKPDYQKALTTDFISTPDDTYLTYASDLITNADYEFDLNGDGTIIFTPYQDAASLTPVFTYTDDNSSILYPDITMDRDIYSIPNVVEVVYSLNSGYYFGRAVNDDPNSPTSTVARGREITHRETNPELYGAANQAQVDEYARNLLRDLSTLECKLSYSHGYNGVRVKDCVRLNYSRSGIEDVKAKVVSQTIDCAAGCKVTETAAFITKLWG